MLESYNTASITFIQLTLSKMYYAKFAQTDLHVFCSEKDWKIMQPMKTKLDDDSAN